MPVCLICHKVQHVLRINHQTTEKIVIPTLTNRSVMRRGDTPAIPATALRIEFFAASRL